MGFVHTNDIVMTVRYVMAVDIAGNNLVRICNAIQDSLSEALVVLHSIRHRDTGRDDRDIGVLWNATPVAGLREAGRGS